MNEATFYIISIIRYSGRGKAIRIVKRLVDGCNSEGVKKKGGLKLSDTVFTSLVIPVW